LLGPGDGIEYVPIVGRGTNRVRAARRLAGVASRRWLLLHALPAIVACATTPAVAGTEEIEVEVLNVAFDHASNSPVVVLQDKGKRKALPIWVGPSEAQAIAMEMQGMSAPRPLTHDLMKTIVESLGGEVDRVVIEELRGSTYYAGIHLAARGDRVRIDSRPSDAIALALRCGKPIFVNATLLSHEGAVDLVGAAAPASHLWGLTLQDVTEGLAEVFSLAAADGVLVSDVAGGAAAVVERGDVITNVNGDAVRGLAELRARAAALATGAPIRLGLTRRGAQMQVSFTPSEP
jgi:bifunctional DNase/RNase